MRAVINPKKIFLFLLPTLVIVAQWISIAGINLSWVISALLLLLSFKGIGKIFKNIKLLLILAAVLVIPFVNFFFSPSHSFTFGLYVSIATGLVYMLYIIQLDDGGFDTFTAGALFSCALFALWGIFEIFTGIYILANNEYFTTTLNIFGQHYPCVAFTNTNDISQYLVMLFPLVSARLLKKHKITYVLVLLAILFVVFHSFSKLSMISIVLFFGILFLLKVFLDNNTKAIMRLIGMIAIVVVALLVVELSTGLVSEVFKRFIVVDSSADYVTGRVELYYNLIKASLTRPIGGFGTAYAVNDMPPHNFFLFILSDYGWIPAALFAVLLVSMFVQYWRKAKRDKTDIFALLLCTSICIFPIMSCVSSVNEQRKIVWLFLGIALRMYFQYAKERKECVEKNRN